MEKKSGYTPQKNEYTQQYIRDHYRQLSVRLPREGELTRDRIAAAAARAGESVNGYVLEAVRQRMEKEAGE